MIKQPLDQQAERAGQLVGAVFDQLWNSRGDVSDSLRHDETELTQQPADLVRLRGARPHESPPDPVQGKDRLLLNVLHRDEAHVRPPDRFANDLCVGRIVLVGLDVGLDELRGHQPHRVAHALQLSTPVVRATASLHANQARRQVEEERGHLIAPQLLLQDRLAVLVDAVDLEHVLRQVDANSRDLHGGRPLGSGGW